MTKRISVEAEPREQFTVDLVGKEYLAKAPKSALGVKLGEQIKAANEDPQKMWDIIMDYIKIMFGPKQATAIEKRLESATDDLDIPHIMELVKKITEATTGDPTT